MLLFRPDPKPLSEIAVGESFSVTVTREDWENDRRGKFHSQLCAVANALGRTTGHRYGVTHASAYLFQSADEECPAEAILAHDGADLVSAFDHGEPYPGPTVVTFTRES